MIKRALFAVAGIFTTVSSLIAQPGGLAAFPQAAVFPDRAFPDLLSLGLTNNEAFRFPGSFTQTQVAMSAFLPVFNPTEPRRVQTAQQNRSPLDSKDGYGEISDAQSNLFYAGGEIGFVYGRSTGKHGGDFNQTYFMTEIGNDKFRLSFGASHSEWNGGSRRGGR
ncbi:MAG: hypothetical protein ABI992_04720 [Chthoniobacterales bacterium]